MRPDPDVQQEFQLRDVLAPLAAQKAFIIVFCVSAMLTALVLTYVASEKYESATTISFRPQQVTLFRVQEKQVFGSTAPAPPFEVIRDNLVELIKSERILSDVVLELNLHVPTPKNYHLLPWYTRFYKVTKDFAKETAYKAWEFVRFGRLIEDDPMRGAIRGLRQGVFLIDQTSYIFYLGIRDNYPRRAAAIVDSIARHLVDYLHEEQRSASTARLEQLGTLLTYKQQQIEGYRTEIEGIQTRSKILSPALEAEQAMSRWSELELTRVQIEAEITEMESELTANASFRSDDRGAKRSKASGSIDRIQPADLKRLESERLFNEIQLNGLRARHASVKASIAEVERQRKVLPALSSQLGDLESRLEVAKREHLQLADAYQEAAVQVASAGSEAEVLHPAIIPGAPVAPIKVYHVGLAAFMAFFVAAGLVYLLTFAEVYVLFPPALDATSRLDS